MIVQLNPVTRALNGQNVNDFYSASLIGMSKKKYCIIITIDSGMEGYFMDVCTLEGIHAPGHIFINNSCRNCD